MMNRKRFGIISALLLFAAGALFTSYKLNSQSLPGAAGNPSILSRPGGTFYAPGFLWQARIISGNTSTGSQAIVIAGNAGGGAGGLQLPDGTTLSLQTAFSTLTPLVVDWGQGAQETVTPTAVSVGTCPAGNLGVGGSMQCATVTASFSNTHGQSGVVVDGSFGVQTAVNYAHLLGGGIVSVDSAWEQVGGTNAILSAAVPYFDVSLVDYRAGQVVYWNPQGGLTTLAAPATLTAVTALPSTSPVGAFTATAYNMCIAYVDILGQEGPCSTSFVNTGAGATSSFVFSAPAASTGAVGYTIYIGLTGAGSTTLQYKVPITSTICTLTALETTTAACALANTTYAQTGATATVTAITVNTSPIQPAVTVVSTTAVYVPNAGGRTTYAYIPGSHVGFFGLPGAWLPFTISAADATTVPSVLGTINLPPGIMNFAGRTLEVCGYATTSASTGTIQDIQFQWDALGQNTAGKGVQIGDLTVTKTATSVLQLTFCEDFQTTVAGASATAGSIQNAGGFITSSIASLSAAAAGGNTQAGATASLNLAAEARINVVYVHTTNTDGTALTLQSLSAKVIN